MLTESMAKPKAKRASCKRDAQAHGQGQEDRERWHEGRGYVARKQGTQVSHQVQVLAEDRREGEATCE